MQQSYLCLPLLFNCEQPKARELDRCALSYLLDAFPYKVRRAKVTWAGLLSFLKPAL